VVEAKSAGDLIDVKKLGQAVEGGGHLFRIAIGQKGRVVDGEGLADNRRALKQLAAWRRQLVETPTNDALQSERHLDGAQRPRARQFDNEKRVAPGAFETWHPGAAGRVSELMRGGLVERVERDEEPVAAWTHATLRCELRPGGADNEQRQVQAECESIEELHDLGVGPVEVVDPEHDRSRARERGEITPPGIGDLILSLSARQRGQLTADAQTGAVRDGRHHPLALRGIVEQSRHAVGEVLDDCNVVPGDGPGG